MINEKYIRVGAKVICNCHDRTNVNFGDHGTVAQIFPGDSTLKILLDRTSDQDFCYWDYGTYPEDFSFVREELAAVCEYISDLSLFPVPDSEPNALLSREAHKRQRSIDIMEAAILKIRNGEAIPTAWWSELYEIAPVE